MKNAKYFCLYSVKTNLVKTAALYPLFPKKRNFKNLDLVRKTPFKNLDLVRKMPFKNLDLVRKTRFKNLDLVQNQK